MLTARPSGSRSSWGIVVAVAALVFAGYSGMASGDDIKVVLSGDQEMFPPGRERLAANPSPTGSGMATITMGTLAVAFLAACTTAGRPCHDDVNVRPHQLLGQARETLVSTLRKAWMDDAGLSLDVTEFAHALTKTLIQVCRRGICGKKPYLPDFGLILGKRAERHRQRACAQREQDFPPRSDPTLSSCNPGPGPIIGLELRLLPYS
jgi:hypothetical protein